MKKLALIKKMFREGRIGLEMAISAIQFLNKSLDAIQARRMLGV